MAFKIYTKTGDDGTTGLFGGDRVNKHHSRVEAYGTTDELNSFIGLARTKVSLKSDEILITVQNKLFVIGADIATPNAKETTSSPRIKITESDINYLEQQIDSLDKELPQLKAFILPSGCEAACYLHISRTVARRAERIFVRLKTEEENISQENIIYLNRLSDLLFTLARYENYVVLGTEQEWHNG